jgi:hypothetical protein
MAEHPDRLDPHGAALTVYLISWQREWAAEGAVASPCATSAAALIGWTLPARSLTAE